MKRILALVLALVLTLSLFSCSGEKKDKEGENEKDIASLTATELYERGVEKNKNLKSAQYETKVFLGEEEVSTIETIRVRGGYDGYDYSRKGREEVYFIGGNAYISGDMGKFVSPATARGFDQFLSEFVFPVYGQDPQLLSGAKREKNTVSYSITAKSVFSLYDSVLENDEFTARTLEGKATFTEEAVLKEETITLTGQGRDGKETTLTLKTTLTKMRDESIKIQGPESGDDFVVLSDIRLPGKIALAVENLYGEENFQATLVSSSTLTTGEGVFAYNKDVNLYKTTSSEKENYYLSRQSLKQSPDGEESLFYQCLVKDGAKKEARYDVLTGTLLSEGSGNEKDFDIFSQVREILPSFADFESLTMTEDMKGYSISFTLSEKACGAVLKNLATLVGVGDGSGFAVSECSGTLSVSKESGNLSAFAYTVTAEKGGEKAVGRYSFLLDQTGEITFPQWQNPTATTPGQAS